MMRGRPADLRDVLELRRGRAPLGARARGHARGAAQARPAVRPDRERPPLRAAPVRDRRALRPRPDAGRDVQAAKRLRARRARRALARRREACTASKAATSRRRWRRLAVGEATGSEAQKPKKNEVGERKVVVLGSGNLGLVYLMDEPRRLTLEEIEERHPQLLPALREHPHVGWILARSREHGAVALGGAGIHYLEQGRVDGDDPLARFGPERAASPAAHGRLPARRRPHDRQLLRPRSRRGLRVRGADLVPRRARRPADASPSSSTRSRCRRPRRRSSARSRCTRVLLGWRQQLQAETGL